MTAAQLIWGLPTGLGCSIAGKWLCLNDVARLDTGFCHTSLRTVLHEAIFQSSQFTSSNLFTNSLEEPYTRNNIIMGASQRNPDREGQSDDAEQQGLV